MKKSPAIAVLSAPWSAIAIACRKCGKKLGGGFGPEGDEKLSRAVRTHLRATGDRKALRVIETGCLGVCPKGAVTAIRVDRPGEFIVIPAGTSGQGLVASLLPGSGAPAPRHSK